MLNVSTHQTDIACGAITVRFTKEPDGSRVSLQLLPAGTENTTVAPRKRLNGVEYEVLSPSLKAVPANVAESCVQLKLRCDRGPKAFAQGRTLCLGPATEALRFVRQEVEGSGETGTYIRTVLEGECQGARYRTIQHLKAPAGAPYIQAWTTCENVGEASFTLEMLASFHLDHLTPFHEGTAPERLRLHRFRSCWSLEGRHECPLLEDLHLERSWAGYSIFSERFGQVGSMPVRGFFPFAAIEDTEAGVLWGVQLAHPGSWQLEVLRRHDKAMLTGGLADRELGHWWKALAPKESFTTPVATLTCLRGDLDDLCERLLQAQKATVGEITGDEGIPPIFNEWCSSWGNPTHDYVLATADRLKETKTRYLVIDDGWAERPGDLFQQNGDWIINRKAFPDGLKATCDAIRERGLIPGIWFEFEVCNDGSKAFDKTDHHLTRDGEVLTIGNRRFWDFRDRWVVDYLSERVIALLRDNGFGYLKVDYNETLGIGVDELGDAAPGSPGEGLRQHLAGVQAFFLKIRRELPDLLIENCSSGGHRLEPSMQALCTMGSFSDAHEGVEIPIIAANLQSLILPEQSQVWAVLKATDSIQRIRYSLASTFLGRMCVSGDVKGMTDEHFAELKAAQTLYEQAAPVIREGRSALHREVGKSWRTPKGWQASVRSGQGQAEGKALVVLHRFADAPAECAVELPEGSWKVIGQLNASEGFEITGHTLHVRTAGNHTGHVLLLETAE